MTFWRRRIKRGAGRRGPRGGGGVGREVCLRPPPRRLPVRCPRSRSTRPTVPPAPTCIRPPSRVAALVLGHGAGGGVAARRPQGGHRGRASEGFSVALVEQPYRVAGRRAPAPAHQLDAAWTAVAEHLRAGELSGLPLVTGGRSLGARVACRTVEATGAVAVLCLAFPVHAPGRTAPEHSRLPELDAVSVPVLVVQGESDPFGMPPPGKRRTVVPCRATTA